MVDLALAAPGAPQARWIAAVKRGGARLWLGAALVGILALVALLGRGQGHHCDVRGGGAWRR